MSITFLCPARIRGKLPFFWIRKKGNVTIIEIVINLPNRVENVV